MTITCFTVLLDRPTFMSRTPSRTSESPCLNVCSGSSFRPIVITLRTFNSVEGVTAPCQVLSEEENSVMFRRNRAVTRTARRAMVIILILRRIPICASTNVKDTNLMVSLHALITNVDLTVSRLRSQVMLILRVSARKYLVLTMVTSRRLGQSSSVCSRDRSTRRQSNVLLCDDRLLLILYVHEDASRRRGADRGRDSFLCDFYRLREGDFNCPRKDYLDNSYQGECEGIL